jgi:hypothetical protein
MADIRIKDLATTAASTASDDFVAVDGSANGTRKLNAYSPTFGGNVVATGTLTVNSTTDSSSKDTGAIITEGGLGVEKSASIGGALTVNGAIISTLGNNTTIFNSASATTGYQVFNLQNTSGRLQFGLEASTGGNLITGSTAYATCLTTIGNKPVQIGVDQALIGSFSSTGLAITGALSSTGNLTVSGGTITGGASGMSLAAGGTNQNITLTPSGTGNVNATFGSAAGVALSAPNGSLNDLVVFSVPSSAGGDSSGSRITWKQGASGTIETGYISITQASGFGGTFSLGLNTTNSGNASVVLQVKKNGNLLVGTTIDGGQKLQVAGDATFAGTVTAANQITTTGSSAGFRFDPRDGSGANWLWYNPTGDDARLYNTSGSGDVLTITNAGNATFAGAATSKFAGIIDGSMTYHLNVVNTSAQSSGMASGIAFGNNISNTANTSNILAMAGITGVKENGTANDYASQLKFWTRANGGALTTALTIDSSQNATFAGWVGIKDGSTAPSATSGTAKIYVDTADGDLKVIFGDGTVKTIVTD